MDNRLPPLICSQPGIAFNQQHLDAKDAEIARLKAGVEAGIDLDASRMEQIECLRSLLAEANADRDALRANLQECQIALDETKKTCDCHTWPTWAEMHDYVCAVENRLTEAKAVNQVLWANLTPDQRHALNLKFGETKP